MTQTQTLTIPKEAIDSDWRDDIDYEPYEEERTYISPNEIKKETLAKIKRSPIKLSIRNLVNWDKIDQELNIR